MKKKSPIGKIISVLFKTLMLALVLVLLAPVIYFAWRAGQPMGMPEYDGRTYYVLLVERR